MCWLVLHVTSPVIIDCEESRPTAAGKEEAKYAPLTTVNHFQISQYLNRLTPAEIINIGTKLGLDYVRLKRMPRESLVDDMVHSWLRKDDNVEER